MKRIVTLSFILLLTSYAFGQKKEKIRGSKVITIESRITDDFQNIDVEDNLEVFLVKAENLSIDVEADDNLHEFIRSEVNGTTLRLYTTKNISSAKKVSITIKYNDALKAINAKHSSTINAIEDLKLSDITIKNSDFSKSYLNVISTNFTLIATDKSKVELNLKSDQSIIELSRNTVLKALISSPILAIDMYQKAIANVEGDSNELKLRLDNNTNFTGKNMTANAIILTTEEASVSSIFGVNTIEIEASGKSQTQIFGTPKIEMKSFADNAILYKKEK